MSRSPRLGFTAGWNTTAVGIGCPLCAIEPTGATSLPLVAAIILFVVGANPGNGVVKAIHDAGARLVGPFKNLFSIHGAKIAMVVNWDLAALVYRVAGHLIASLLMRLTPRRRPIAV